MVAVKGGWVYYVLMGICLERVYVEMESERTGEQWTEITICISLLLRPSLYSVCGSDSLELALVSDG
jgi:hypothetical protein